MGLSAYSTPSGPTGIDTSGGWSGTVVEGSVAGGAVDDVGVGSGAGSAVVQAEAAIASSTTAAIGERFT
jgi:hypothetical protein